MNGFLLSPSSCQLRSSPFQLCHHLGKMWCISWTAKEREQLIFNVTISQGVPMAVEPPILHLSHKVPGPWLAADGALLARIQLLPAQMCCLLKDVGVQQTANCPLKHSFLRVYWRTLLQCFPHQGFACFDLFPPKGSS